MKEKKWNPYEIFFFLFFLVLGFFIKIRGGGTWLDLSALLAGGASVILTTRGSMWNFPLTIYNTIVYAFLAYKNHLYADVASDIFLAIPINIIGLINWKKKQNGKTVKMKKLNVKKICALVLFIAVLMGLTGFALSFIKTQNNPYLDGFTFIISNAARILKSLRYREQWLFYTIQNIFMVAKWIRRFLAKASDSKMMVLMWSAYLLNSVYAWHVWTKGAKKDEKK
jgi:nicotinamide mononucleotide transporter